jgi:hypothetical protein
MISAVLEKDSPWAIQVFLPAIIFMCLGGMVYMKPLSIISAVLHVSCDCDYL